MGVVGVMFGGGASIFREPFASCTVALYWMRDQTPGPIYPSRVGLVLSRRLTLSVVSSGILRDFTWDGSNRVVSDHKEKNDIS